MRLTLVTSLALLFFVSCSESTETETTETTDNVESTDSVAIDATEEVIEETPSYTYIEDYLTLETKDQVFEALGENNLEEGSSWYAEGTVELKHIVYTNPDNDQIIKFVMSEESPENVSSLEVHYFVWNENFEIERNQKVESSCGFYTGMPLADLVELNGAPLNFSGFGWDFAGSIMSKNGGTLEDCKANFRLDQDEYEGEYSTELLGDMELNSDMEAVKNGHVIVEEITIYRD